MKSEKIFFTGGGSGGHVFPAIAVIEKLKQELPSLKFYWLGEKKGIEAKILKDYPFINFINIPAGKLRRYFSFQNFTDAFKVIFSLIKCLIILKKHKPLLVFSKGGFVSTPPIIAASLLKIVAITHESDLDPGLATKINSKFANIILVSFRESFKYFKNKNVIYTGNPIRSEFLNPKREIFNLLSKNTDKKVISIFGGSLGAASLNKFALKLKENTAAFIIHQSGESIPDIEESHYLRRQFFNVEEMASLIKYSTLIISRAGANSIKEFAELKACVIFAPFKRGSRGDQIRNAKLLLESKACIIIDEESEEEALILKINALLNDEERQKELRENIEKFKDSDSAQLIKNIIKEKLNLGK